MKIAVAIVIRALGIGGAEKQCLLLAKNLKSDYNVFVFVQKESPREKKYLDIINKEGIQCIQLSGNIIKRIKQLNFHIRDKEIKVAFSYLTIDNIIISICGKVNKKLITVGGIRNCQLPKYKFCISKILHKYFLDYTIFNNYTGKENFINLGFIERKSIVIPNCFDSIPELSNKSEDGKIRVLSVGRFVAQKDYITAIKAFSHLQITNRNQEFKYTIIGYGILEKKIREYIKTKRIDNIDVIIKPTNLNDFYKTADIYLSTSIFEGLSNTLMEALSYALPIVATNVGDNKYLINENRNGYLVKIKDYKQIAEKMNQLTLDEKKRKHFGLEGRNLLGRNYSENALRNKYTKFLNEVLTTNNFSDERIPG